LDRVVFFEQATGNEATLLAKEPAEQAALGVVSFDRAALSFEESIAPHTDAVRRFARALCGDWQDADDVAQEALLKAYKSMHTYRGEAAMRTWLYVITRSVCATYYTSRQVRQRHGEVELTREPLDSSPDQEGLLGEKSRAERLWQLLAELDESFRAVLVLADLEGESYESISEIEGIAVGTVRSRLNRARKQLREKLQKRTQIEEREGMA
jgi:RNA polymerase sigma-70 factor (ECF subfamily)